MIYNINGISCEVIDLDTYNAFYESELLPEYKGKGENLLLEELESQDDLFSIRNIELYVDGEKTKHGADLKFVFDNCIPMESKQTEIVIFEFKYCSINPIL